MKRTKIMLLIATTVLGAGLLSGCSKKHEHSYGEWEVKDSATHTHDGVQHRDCDCGECEEAPLPKTNAHEWSEWQITKPATHTEDGIRTRTCPCGASENEVISKTNGHEWGEWIITEEPTHTKNGTRERTCACGEKESAPHEAGDWILDQAAAYGVVGSHHKECTVCGYVMQTEEIPALGHNYVNGVCTRCGEEEPLGYALVTDASTLKAGDVLVLGCAASNKAAGPMGGNTYFASVDATINDGVLNSENAIELALSGSSAAWTLTTSEGVISTAEAKKLNLTNNGSTTWTITISNNSASITSSTSSYGTIKYNSQSPRFLNYASGQTAIEIYKKIVPACKHPNKVPHPAVSAGCLTTGNDLYYTCPDCEKILAADGVTELDAIPTKPATGHNYPNNGAYTVKLQPTCTSAGSKERTCLTCGNKDVVSIPVDSSAHSLKLNIGKEATQSETGIERHYVCELCGKKFWDSNASQEITDENDLITPIVTCEHTTTGGWVEGEDSHSHVCSKCGESYDVELHTYGEGEETPSTCTTQGKITYTCTKCGHVKEEILDLKAHTHVSVAKVDSTFEQTGVEAHYECSECHKLFTKVSEQYIEVSAQDLVIPTKEHAFNGEYQHNDTEHWRMCSDAGYETLEGEHVNHTFVKNTALSEEPTASSEGILVEECVCGATRKSLVNPLKSIESFEKYTSSSLEEGYYILEEGGYYVGNTNGDRIDNGTAPTLSGTTITGADPSIIYHITEVDGYWVLFNEAVSKYIATGGKNKGKMVSNVSDDTKFSVTIDSTNHTFDFENLARSQASSDSANKWLHRNQALGWGTYSSSTGKPLTLYKGVQTTKVAIRYEDGEGNKVASSVGVPGASLKMNDGSSLPKEGYYVSGWQDAEGNEVNLTKFPSESMIVYPVWSERTVEYTVKYQPNYSGATEYSTTVAENATHSVLDVTDTKLGYSRVGYTFAGWKDAAGTIVSAGASQKITADLTLTAQWEKINYKFTFTATGGECTNESQVFTIDDGSLVIPSFEGTAPAAKKFDCWTVAGVDKQPGETIAITSETPEETALVAKWGALDLTATYELDGGTNNDKNVSTFTVDDAAHTLYHPTKEGFVFTGWTIDGQPVSTIKKGTSENVTVTANWAEAVNKHYQLVESVEGVEDLSGEYLLVAQKGDKYYAFDSVLNDLDQSQNLEEVVINEGMIVAPDAYAVQIEKLENGSYSIKTSNGVSVGQSGSSANVAVRASEYSITDEGIKTGDYFLKMNTNDVRFRFYKSGQTDVKLYKLVEYTELAEQFEVMQDGHFEQNSSTVFVENAKVENGQAIITASENGQLFTIKAETGKVIKSISVELDQTYTVWAKTAKDEVFREVKNGKFADEVMTKAKRAGGVPDIVNLPEGVTSVMVQATAGGDVTLSALSVNTAIEVVRDLGFFYEEGVITRGQLHFDVDVKFVTENVAEYGFLMTTDLSKDPTELGTWDIFDEALVEGYKKYADITSLTLGTANLSKQIKVVFYTIDNDANLVMSEVVVASFNDLVMAHSEDLVVDLVKEGTLSDAQEVFTNYRASLFVE